ncbi:Protein of unknown function [Pyronema omphalodes CBS 100304]|uniref:Uncharacterized protein n=1 Tax=Pyronema omphalodes (strain CBS 100304) TaxID=1076935 RepID=U4LRM0_PYROM|nr:Protein of unknown function [Pyronema omphalodes CBS 100304]
MVMKRRYKTTGWIGTRKVPGSWVMGMLKRD